MGGNQEVGAGQGGAATPVTPLMVQHLQATRPWVLFLSILAFIASGLMVVAGLDMMAMGMRPGFYWFPLPILGLACLVMAGLYAAAAGLLLSYARAIKRCCCSASSGDMELALRRQTSVWKFIGAMAILTTVALVICLGVPLILMILQ